jgi:hypothetical protein
MEASDQVLPVDGDQAGASRRRFLGRAAGTAAVSLGVVGAAVAKAPAARAQSAEPADYNILNYGADPTGETDSYQAISAAISDATSGLVQPPGITITSMVYVPCGDYLVSQPLTFPAPVRLAGDGSGSRIFSTSGGIIDFGNIGLYGLAIDHLTLDATGGHVFENANVHRSCFSDLLLVQRSPEFSIWDTGTATSGVGLSTTHFDRITSYAYCDPATGLRSAPAWNLYCAGDKFVDVVHFSQCSSFNASPTAGGGPVDNTQYFFEIACTQGGGDKGASMDRFFMTQCDFNSCLGGAIRVLSCSGLVLDQIGCGNLAPSGAQTHKPGVNSLIYVGTYPDGPGSQQTVIRNYVREGAGITLGAGNPSDIEIDAGCTNTTIVAPCAVDTATAIQVNVHGSAGAVIINPQSGSQAISLLSPASDTTLVGDGPAQAFTGTNGWAQASGQGQWQYQLRGTELEIVGMVVVPAGYSGGQEMAAVPYSPAHNASLIAFDTTANQTLRLVLNTAGALLFEGPAGNTSAGRQVYIPAQRVNLTA